jgi:hypothetical protein
MFLSAQGHVIQGEFEVIWGSLLKWFWVPWITDSDHEKDLLNDPVGVKDFHKNWFCTNN